MAEKSALTLDNVINFPWGGASNPDLSADGRQVIYADAGALWLVDTAGGQPQRVTQGAQPRWSPVGDEIAFLRGQPAQLWMREPDGQERPVTDHAAGVKDFAWSPDGRRIATISSTEQAPTGDAESAPESI